MYILDEIFQEVQGNVMSAIINRMSNLHFIGYKMDIKSQKMDMSAAVI